jgi:hypothetical protein
MCGHSEATYFVHGHEDEADAWEFSCPGCDLHGHGGGPEAAYTAFLRERQRRGERLTSSEEMRVAFTERRLGGTAANC